MIETKLTIEDSPATTERWEDLERLFGANGAFAGCWCMFWRLAWGDFKKMNLSFITRRNQ